MDLHHSLGYLLNTCARLVKRRLDMFLKRYGITTTQWAVLKLLATQDNRSQADIADTLHIDRATCGTVIDKLIEKKLLAKALFDDDRRSYRVQILPEAEKLVEQAIPFAEMVNHTLVQGLSETEIAILEKCLHTMIENLEGNRYGLER